MHLIPSTRYIFFYFSLILTYFIYSPGLTGDFLFDDYSNLNNLGNIKKGFSGIYEYIRHSQGRPLAYLSFLIDDNYWPSNAYSFLRTNIYLHLLSGVLLIWLIFKICQSLNLKLVQSEWIAILTGTFWLIHPFFVSTTLYVVQRMSILSALFSISSLLCYVHGRKKLVNSQQSAWIWLILGTALFGITGALCKQNAALIPFYLLIFEKILFQNHPIQHPYYRYWQWLYIYLPIALLILIAFLKADTWLAPYDIRSFSVTERLLTQTRVIALYLFLLFIPHSTTNGLHYENFIVSKDLLTPLTTFSATVFLITIIIFCIKIRRTRPILSTSILFYFAGHLMESSFIALELYYEHRNYLPSMLLFFAAAYYLIKLYNHRKLLSVSIISILILTYSALTYSRTALWGNPLLLMSVWTDNNPTSARNYAEAHIKANNLHRPLLAKSFLEKGVKALPEEVHLLMGLMSYSCEDGSLKKEDIEKLILLLKTTNQVKRVYLYHNLKQLIDIYTKKYCSGFKYEDLKNILETTLQNPHIKTYTIRQQEIIHLIGRLNLTIPDYPTATDKFYQAFKLNPQPLFALQQIALLATHEQYILALEYLRKTEQNIYQSLPLEKKEKIHGWSEYKDMESRLLKEIEHNKMNINSPVSN